MSDPKYETISKIEDDLLAAMVKLVVRLGAEDGEARICAALTAIRAARAIGSPALNQPAQRRTELAPPPAPGSDRDWLVDTLYRPEELH